MTGIIVHYRSPGTIEQYGLVQKKLLEKGVIPFPGNRVHVAYEADDHVQIIEVWDREDLFLEFGKIVYPLMLDVGMQPGYPDINRIAEFRTQ